MANAAIDIPFYVSKDGSPLTDAAAEMNFQSLKTIGGVDKITAAPAITEIATGWYKFSVAYGSAPFDDEDLVGVINADKDGNNNLANAEKYIPVEIRLDFYALLRNVGQMAQDKFTGDMQIKNSAGQTVLTMNMIDNETEVLRQPAAE